LPSGACPAPTGSSCTNGVNVAAYRNNISYSLRYGSATSNVGPDYNIGMTPYAQGIATSLSVPYVGTDSGPTVATANGPLYYLDAASTPYAGFSYDANNSTLLFTGYFEPPVSGTYTICSEGDNLDNFYFGSANAFSCGSTATPTGSTPDIVATYTAQVCKIFTLTVNLLYPIRSVYGMVELPSSLNTTITGPGSSTPLDLSTLLIPQNSPYV
ncbi:hypothetical protein EK21DRAFT_79564, partial [Setomelanomma holmii]